MEKKYKENKRDRQAGISKYRGFISKLAGPSEMKDLPDEVSLEFPQCSVTGSSSSQARSAQYFS